MDEKEKETMKRIITKANNPKVEEAAAIFASGYSSGYDAGVAAGSEKETTVVRLIPVIGGTGESNEM